MKTKKKKNAVYIWIIGLFALGCVVYAVSARWNMISKATSSQSMHIRQPTTVSPPYIRFETVPSRYSVGQKILMDVYLHTNGLPTTEMVIIAAYDPSMITLTERDITNTGVYPVINIESVSHGRIVFSLFSNTALGYPMVTLSTEKVVAHLNFTAVQSAPDGTRVDVLMKKATAETSGIFGTRKIPGEPLQNILLNVQSAVVHIDK